MASNAIFFKKFIFNMYLVARFLLKSSDFDMTVS